MRYRALRRLRRSLPPLRTAFVGALLWAMAMGASALLNLQLYDWETPAKVRFVSLLYAAGGALAFRLGCFWRDSSPSDATGRSPSLPPSSAFSP